MGIIQKQALRNTIITFTGISIGLATNVIKPIVLTRSEIGALGLLDTISVLFATIFCLGFAQISFRMFDTFKSSKSGIGGYLFFGLILSLIGSVLGVISFFILESFLIGSSESTYSIQKIAHFIIPLIVFRLFFKNLDMYFSMTLNSVLGTFLEGFVLKLILFIGLLFLWVGFIDYSNLVSIYVLAFSLPGITILIFAFWKNKEPIKLNMDFLNKTNKRNLVQYITYGVFASAASIIVLAIDQIMVNKILGTEQTGVYTLMFFAGALVAIPSRGIKKISTPILSNSWAKNDINNIDLVYKKSVQNNLIVGGFLLIIGWSCIDYVLNYIPEYKEGLYVFLFIALAKIVDVMSGVNAEILATSKKYKMNVIFNFSLALILIVLNYFLINYYGLIGASIATLIAMVIVNFARWFYLKKVFNLQPMNRTTIVSVFVISIFMLVVSNLPQFFDNLLIQILFNGIVFSFLYWVLVLRLNLAMDIKIWINKVTKSRL